MLRGEGLQNKDAAVKCLEVMSTSDSTHWQSILAAGEWPVYNLKFLSLIHP